MLRLKTGYLLDRPGGRGRIYRQLRRQAFRRQGRSRLFDISTVGAPDDQWLEKRMSPWRPEAEDAGFAQAVNRSNKPNSVCPGRSARAAGQKRQTKPIWAPKPPPAAPAKAPNKANLAVLSSETRIGVGKQSQLGRRTTHAGPLPESGQVDAPNKANLGGHGLRFTPERRTNKPNFGVFELKTQIGWPQSLVKRSFWGTIEGIGQCQRRALCGDSHPQGGETTPHKAFKSRTRSFTFVQDDNIPVRKSKFDTKARIVRPLTGAFHFCRWSTPNRGHRLCHSKAEKDSPEKSTYKHQVHPF